MQVLLILYMSIQLDTKLAVSVFPSIITCIYNVYANCLIRYIFPWSPIDKELQTIEGYCVITITSMYKMLVISCFKSFGFHTKILYHNVNIFVCIL